MKQRILLAALLLTLVCTNRMQAMIEPSVAPVAEAQSGDSIIFQGRVVNGQGIPLKDATVVAQNAGVSVRTGADGIFSLTLASKDIVVVEKEGLATFRWLADYSYKGIVVLGAEQSSWMPYAEYVKQMSPTAQKYLDAGLKFLSGEDGQAPDEKKAMACFWRAAGMEYPRGYYYLGRMLEEGRGVSQDVEAAVSYYEKATGVAEAFTRLGELFAEGKLVPQDYKKAVRFYFQAVDYGDTQVAKPAFDKLLAEGLASKDDLEDMKIHEKVEVNASFPGGDQACYQWLAQHLKYPAKAQEQNIQGRVFVQFVVEKDGSITDVKVLRSPDPSLSQEAARVVSLMPQWRPARQGDKKRRSRFNLPIMFSLPSQAK